MRRFMGIIFLILIVVGVAVVYWRYYWTFGEGVKAGELNYVVKKGYIFKTYEGKLIQSGFRGGTPGAIQSYDFEFSVINESIAQQLMVNSGKVFELHYKEYMGALPWHGNTPFIVDSILSMRPGSGSLQQISPTPQ